MAVIALAGGLGAPGATTTAMVRRGGAQTVQELNAALLGNLVEDKLLRCRKLPSTRPLRKPTSTTPRTPTCSNTRYASWVGWLGGSRSPGQPGVPLP